MAKFRTYVSPATERIAVLMEEPALAGSVPEGNSVIKFGGLGGEPAEQKFDDDAFSLNSFGDGSWNDKGK